MKTQNQKDWSISYCGLNCAKCDMYEAGHGNLKLRDEIVAWFLKERNEVVKPEKIRCEGCKGSLDIHWSADCKMMLCAKEKSVRYCFECRDFPCKFLSDFASDGTPHHKRTVENLTRMKEIGIDAWITEHEKEGKITFCP